MGLAPNSLPALMPASLNRNLITGGAGFLGSDLTYRLMQAVEEVICLDNYVNGLKAKSAQWIGHPRNEMIWNDVKDQLRTEVDRYLASGPRGLAGVLPVKSFKKTNISFLGIHNMTG